MRHFLSRFSEMIKRVYFAYLLVALPVVIQMNINEKYAVNAI